MSKQRHGPLFLSLVLGIATGCHYGVAEAGPPAPFATPPVLPGTPDVATLVAKVTPAVVNITTIHDLATNKYVLWAQAINVLSK